MTEAASAPEESGGPGLRTNPVDAKDGKLYFCEVKLGFAPAPIVLAVRDGLVIDVNNPMLRWTIFDKKAMAPRNVPIKTVLEFYSRPRDPVNKPFEHDLKQARWMSTEEGNEAFDSRYAA